MTKLHEAVAAQDEPLVTKLLSPDTVNVRDADGCIPLHLTAEYTDDTETTREIINALIEAGSDLDAGNNKGYIPLRKGIRSGNTVLFHCLKDLEHTKNYLKDVEQAVRVFFDAVLSSNFEILNWVLSTQLPGFINQRSEKLGRSALHYAIETDCFEPFKWLLNQPGIKLHQFDIYQRTPLHYTIRYEKFEYFRILWTVLCESNLISSEDWIEFFKYTYCKYIPLQKSSVEFERVPFTMELDNNYYELIPPFFLMGLFSKLLQDISYGVRLTLVIDCFIDDVRNIDINEQIENLNLSKEIYFIIKFMMVTALVIAKATSFGLLEAPPLETTQTSLDSLVETFNLLNSSAYFQNMFEKALYFILYPHYVMRHIQTYLQMTQHCNITQIKNKTISSLMPHQILDLFACVWFYWDMNNKLETICALGVAF